MKPFNLEEALAGKPVVTRDGRKVTEIYHFKTASDETKYVLYAVIEGAIHTYLLNGFYMSRGINDTDLFMEERLIECWVSLYGTIYGEIWVGDVCNTYESALIRKDSECGDESYYIKTIKINNRPC